ncbi:LOW QUALITY PROTEIN: transcription elongation factor, mitochondrial [Calonectris borealis]|uniref:LOW QUALITY PROTEIN: transcription elongation factor, mitochondrial n=1 Tax=Calonectris borealis TaxID=1323832 RepID=UPI003F4B7064
MRNWRSCFQEEGSSTHLQVCLNSTSGLSLKTVILKSLLANRTASAHQASIKALIRPTAGELRLPRRSSASLRVLNTVSEEELCDTKVLQGKKPVGITQHRENGACQDLQSLMKMSLFQDKADVKKSVDCRHGFCLFPFQVSSVIPKMPEADFYALEEKVFSAPKSSTSFFLTLHFHTVEAMLCALLHKTHKRLDGQLKVLSRAQTIVGKHFESKVGDFRSTGMDLVKHFLSS